MKMNSIDEGIRGLLDEEKEEKLNALISSMISDATPLLKTSSGFSAAVIWSQLTLNLFMQKMESTHKEELADWMESTIKNMLCFTSSVNIIPPECFKNE